VLLSMGCGYAGYAFFMIGGRLMYVHNYVGLAEYEVVSPDPIAPGAAQLVFEFTKNGEHTGLGVLSVNGERVASAPIERTCPRFLGGAERAVGFNPGSGVPSRYRDRGEFPFNGHLARVVLDTEGAPPSDNSQALERVALAIQ